LGSSGFLLELASLNARSAQVTNEERSHEIAGRGELLHPTLKHEPIDVSTKQRVIRHAHGILLALLETMAATRTVMSKIIGCDVPFEEIKEKPNVPRFLRHCVFAKAGHGREQHDKQTLPEVWSCFSDIGRVLSRPPIDGCFHMS